jgi:fumarylacetoacetase
VSADIWVELPEDTPFPADNLPYGVFTTGGRPRVGVAIGDHILDVTSAAEDGLVGTAPEGTFAGGSLNAFAALGAEVWAPTRERIAELLQNRAAMDKVTLVPQSAARMLLPVTIGDYVDFYSSLHHATNVGMMFRPDQEPLPANWRHLPIGYHGRTSTIVVSGTAVQRPWGQQRGDAGPVFAPSSRLDFEAEVGFVIGPGNGDGSPIAAGDAEEHILGLCLVNDWSARDIQAWEYIPLGPFLGKSFATTMSPWIVPLAALAPSRVPPTPQDPEVLPHLRTSGDTAIDLELTVAINGTVVSRCAFRDMYWTMAQQVAHLTSNGTVVRPGDLCASGTVSGPTPRSEGSLLELTWNGERPLPLDDGTTRTFLEDGDGVVMAGWAGEVGFGVCAGTVLPAG